MKNIVVTAITVAAGLFACGQGRKSMPNTDAAKIVALAKNSQSQKLGGKYIYAEYVYADSAGARLTIQNSFPKSGINYLAPNGKSYVYAVFWTRIINDTAKPVELVLDFPVDSFELPPTSGNYMRLLVPSDTMTLAKEPLTDYGLAAKAFLDNDARKSSSLKRIIRPKESSGFYVVPLSTHGVGGMLRTELSLKGKHLMYQVSGKEIPCGNINLKKLVLQK